MKNRRDIWAARRALEEARQLRATVLLDVNKGWMTPTQVVLLSREVTAYRKLHLVTLLSAQEGWTATRASKVVRRFATLMRHHGTRDSVVPAKMTVGWLGKSTAHPSRLELWEDALTDSRDYAPWPGFPYAVRP